MKAISTLIASLTLTFCTGTPPSPSTQYHTMALKAGFTEAEWPTVKCIIARESGGNRFAHNAADPGFGSFGLMQLNMSRGSQGTWTFYKARLHHNISNLYVPMVNFTIAHDMYIRSKRMYGWGWRPWGRCG